MTVFAHLDMDSFFLSVENALRPGLIERPSAVAGSSVILSASYPARAQGVHAGMSVASARSCCPSLTVVPSRHGAYVRAGRSVFDLVASFGGEVSPASVDEAYWDISSLVPDLGQDPEPSAALAATVRARLRERFNLPVSFGVAPSRLVAKMATNAAKPDGLLVVGDVDKFLPPLPVSALPGVGPALSERLFEECDITDIAQLRACPVASLTSRLGQRTALWLAAAAAGKDVHSVRSPEHSVSAERSFSYATSEVDPMFEQVLAKAIARLEGSASRTVSVKHRSAKEFSLSRTLPAPSADPDELAFVARSLHRQLRDSHALPLRLVGVSFQAVSPWEQSSLPLGLFPAHDLPAPDSFAPALTDLVYVGMELEHPLFGPGRVLGREGPMLRVAFADRIRVLDPVLAPLSF